MAECLEWSSIFEFLSHNSISNILQISIYRAKNCVRLLNWGGAQHLEQPNVEQPIFRNFEILNIKKTKDELFDFFIFIII